jgi:hypothetical protein
MQRRYYNSASLERAISSLEQRYGMSSADFYAAHQADDPALDSMPRRLRNLWASLYRDWRRLSGEDFVEQVEREAEFA